MRNIFLVLILFSIVGKSSAYNIDVVPTTSISIPEDLVMDFSYRQTRVQPEPKMPLFTQTCDNIAYSGVIEQQVINLLTDVKDFVTAATDPVVTVSKFDAGIFMYAFGKCFSKSTKEAFGECKPQRTGETCLSELLTQVVSSEDQVATVEAGGEAGSGSFGFAIKKEISLSKIKGAAANIIPQMIDNGWFDITFECINKERKEIISYLSGIFNRNYKIKTSIINSINKKCEVSIYNDSDPGTWSEIYQLNKELIGGETSAVVDKVEKYIADNITEVDVDSESIKRAINATNCYNGVGSGKCESEADIKNIKRLSEYQIDSTNNEEYQTDKAIEIARHLFMPDGSVKPEYANEVGNTVNPIKEVLESLIPMNNEVLKSEVFNDISTEMFIVEFYNLKDALGIHPSTDLSQAIDDIFYMISAPTYQIKMKKRNGEDFQLANGQEVEFYNSNPISDPGVDPFNKNFIKYSRSGAKDNENVIARTVSGEYIILDTGLDYIIQAAVLNFYRSLAETLIFANSSDIESKYVNKAIYANEKLVDKNNYTIIKESIEKAIEVHSQFKYSHILNKGYEISKKSGDKKASLEYYIIKYLLMKRILKLLYTVEGDPNTEEDNIDVIKVDKSHQLPIDLFYGLISSEKDYSIARRQSVNNIYGKVSRFYKILASKYTENNITDIIETTANQVEDYPNFNSLEVSVNTLLNLARRTSEFNSIESLEIIENIE